MKFLMVVDKSIRLFLIAVALSFSQTSVAQKYPLSQIVTSQPPQIALSRPAYLKPTALSGLDTYIMRISDADALGAGQRYYRHYYSKQQPWNSDGTRLILSIDSSRVYFLNGRTFAYQLTATNVPEYPKWSNSNPDLMYGVICCGAVTFVKYTPSTGTMQNLHTFSEFTDMYLGIGEGNLSDDDRYAPLIGVKNISDLTIVIYDTLNNAEVSRKSFPGAKGAMDWTSMSPSGQYVVVNIYDSVAGKSVYDIYDKQMNFLRRLGVYGGGHADIGYDTAGNEVIVSGHFVGGRGVVVTSTRLSDGTVQEQLATAGPNGTDGIVYLPSDYHISCRNTKRPGYCYISVFSPLYNDLITYPVYTTNSYLYREVFALKLDGTGAVERFSQDFKAEPTSLTPVLDLAYQRASMVVPSRDGSLVLFSSDWQDPTSAAIIYDYVAGTEVGAVSEP